MSEVFSLSDTEPTLDEAIGAVWTAFDEQSNEAALQNAVSTALDAGVSVDDIRLMASEVEFHHYQMNITREG